MILTIGFSPHQTLDITSLVYGVVFPMLLGFGISLMITLILPQSSVALFPVSTKKASILRAARIAVAVSLCFVICDWLGLTHASWAAVSILAICQGTLGATVKKASQRLVGTALGVIAAAPLGLYLFEPYPNARYLVLIIVFFTFLMATRYYALAIFLGTLCFGAIFFVLFPGSHAIIPFITERLFETMLGILIILVLETFISPCSVVFVMRQHTKDFWQQLMLAVASKEEQDFFKYCHKANQALIAFCKHLEEFRYEPLNLLSRRYFFARKVMEALSYHYQLLMKTEKEGELNDELREQLQQAYQRIVCQYNMSNSERIQFLEVLLLELQQTSVATQPPLLSCISNVVSCTLALLKTRSINLLTKE